MLGDFLAHHRQVFDAHRTVEFVGQLRPNIAEVRVQNGDGAAPSVDKASVQEITYADAVRAHKGQIHRFTKSSLRSLLHAFEKTKRFSPTP